MREVNKFGPTIPVTIDDSDHFYESIEAVMDEHSGLRARIDAALLFIIKTLEIESAQAGDFIKWDGTTIGFGQIYRGFVIAARNGCSDELRQVFRHPLDSIVRMQGLVPGPSGRKGEGL